MLGLFTTNYTCKLYCVDVKAAAISYVDARKILSKLCPTNDTSIAQSPHRYGHLSLVACHDFKWIEFCTIVVLYRVHYYCWSCFYFAYLHHWLWAKDFVISSLDTWNKCVHGEETLSSALTILISVEGTPILVNGTSGDRGMAPLLRLTFVQWYCKIKSIIGVQNCSF